MEIKELGSCVDLIIDYRGKTPQKLGGNWTESGFRVISARNVHSGMITDEETIRFVDQDIYNKWMKEPIRRGDCLLASEGASLGESAIWDSDETIVLGQRLYAIRADNKNLDPWYLAYYLQTKDFRKQVDQSATGSTVFGISQPVLCSLKLILPEINVQRKIGEIYKVILNKLINNQAICTDLVKLQETLFDRWFLQYEFADTEGKPYKSNGGKMKYNQELGKDIPDDWSVYSFSELFEFAKGKIPQETYLEKSSDGMVPYLTIEVLNGAIPEYCDISNSTMCSGEVLMVMDGAASGECYVGQTGAIGSTLARLDIKKDEMTAGLLYVVLNKYQKAIKKANTGSTVPHANKDYIQGLKIALPQSDKLIELASRIDTVVKLQANIQKENLQLVFMRDLALPLLMNGQVKISSN